MTSALAPPRYLDVCWSDTRDDFATCPKPAKHDPVVYFLFDAAEVLAYVGATRNFKARMRGHQDKPWVRFEARLCSSRSAADDLELIEIRERKPYLNQSPGSLDAQARARLADGTAR